MWRHFSVPMAGRKTTVPAAELRDLTFRAGAAARFDATVARGLAFPIKP